MKEILGFHPVASRNFEQSERSTGTSEGLNLWGSTSILTLTLDKAETGEGTVLLQLQGNNPDLLSGQPFNFNIRIDSNFDRLAEYALLSIRSAEDLLRRAAGRTGP